MRSDGPVSRGRDLAEASTRLSELAERVREIEWCSGVGVEVRREPLRLPSRGVGRSVEVAWGGLHEWFGLDVEGEAAKGLWLPPLSLLTGLAARAIEEASAGGWMVWIGQRCWPYPGALADLRGGGALLHRSLFVEAPDAQARQWALEVSLRSRGIAAVVADGSGLSMAATRRAQLAAREGGGLALLARPMRDLVSISAAATRWRVAPSPSPRPEPRWIVELLRCKGWRPSDGPGVWAVERDRAQGIVAVPAHMDDGSGSAPARVRETA